MLNLTQKVDSQCFLIKETIIYDLDQNCLYIWIVNILIEYAHKMCGYIVTPSGSTTSTKSNKTAYVAMLC